LTPHFQRRKNYCGNEIWYLSAPSSPCDDTQSWLLARMRSFQFPSRSQVNFKQLLKMPGRQLTRYWAQLSLSHTAGHLPSWHQSSSRQALDFLLPVQKHYIANIECTAQSSLLPEQQPYAMLGTPKTFPSSWALGMGKRRDLSGYSQGLSSQSRF